MRTLSKTLSSASSWVENKFSDAYGLDKKSAYDKDFLLIAFFTLITFSTFALTSSFSLSHILFMTATLFFLFNPEYRFVWLLALLAQIITFFTTDLIGLDNHEFLSLYWLLAITLCVYFTSNKGAAVGLSARILLGLTMLFSGIWKIISPDFLSGKFWEYSFAVDGRLSYWFDLLGVEGSDNLVNENNSSVTDAFIAGDGSVFSLLTFDQISAVSALISIAAVVLDLLFAAVMLLPLKGKAVYLRDIVTVLFVVSHYLIAPVIKFGALVITLAAASSSLKPKTKAVVYISLFAFLIAQIYVTRYLGVVL